MEKLTLQVPTRATKHGQNSDFMYACMNACCMVIAYGRVLINRERGCQSSSWSTEQGKLVFLCPRLRLRIWSRETGSIVPSRVSLLTLHTLAESGAYEQDSSQFLRQRPFIHTTNHYRASPEFIRSRNCVPMAFTAESPPVQSQ